MYYTKLKKEDSTSQEDEGQRDGTGKQKENPRKDQGKRIGDRRR